MPGLLDGTETVGIEKEVGRSFRPPGLEHPRADSEREGDGDAGGGAMSMTRREAAIKSCEDRIRHLESVPPHYYGKRQRGRAIELEKVKIKALRPVSREQVEKVWRGVWKHYLPPLGAGNIQCRCTKCGRTPDVETPFCAWCGAPMTDEAVEMVMERLEALKDDQA